MNRLPSTAKPSVPFTWTMPSRTAPTTRPGFGFFSSNSDANLSCAESLTKDTACSFPCLSVLSQTMAKGVNRTFWSFPSRRHSLVKTNDWPARSMYCDCAAQLCAGRYASAMRTFSTGRCAAARSGVSISSGGRSGITTNGRTATAYTAYSPVRLTAVAIVKSRRENIQWRSAWFEGR